MAVSGNLWTQVNRMDPEGNPVEPACDSAMLLLECENGAHAFIETSAGAFQGDRGAAGCLELHGDAGTVDMQWTMEITPSFYDGLETQEVIEAAITSSREGRSVSIEA